MKTIAYVYLLIIISLFSACTKEEEGVSTTIQLDEAEITINTRGDTKTIYLTANGRWQIENIPEWLTITPSAGDNSAEIIIEAAENRETTTRTTQLLFTAGKINEALTINQFGLSDVVWGPVLPIFQFEYMKIPITGGSFILEAKTLFINPGIKDKIYLGNLISHNTSSHTDIPVFTGYTFNPITVVTWAPVPSEVVKTYIPSQNEQDALAKEIIAQAPSQSQSFMADNGTIEFYDYKRLHTLGIANFGIKLDEVVSGFSFKEKEMEKKYGLIFSFKHTLFSLLMDLPLPQPVIQEELKESDIEQGVSYVSSVSYGKAGLLIVESDTDSQVVKVAINKALGDYSLSQDDIRLISDATISFVYFNENTEVQIDKGGIAVIDAYKNFIQETTGGMHPLEFQLSDYHDHSLNSISFTFDVEE